MPGLISKHRTAALAGGGAAWVVSVVYTGAWLTGLIDPHMSAPRPGQAFAVAVVGAVAGPLVYRHWLAAMEPRRRWAVIAGAWLGLAAMLYVAVAAALAAFGYIVFRVGHRD